MPNPYPTVHFRASELLAPLRARASDGVPDSDEDQGEIGTSIHGIAKRDLGRYYQVVRDELDRLQLTRAEALLICDACNGTWFDEHSYRYLAAEVDETIRLDRLAEKWGVDHEALVSKLLKLSPGGCMAVVDGVSLFWSQPVESTDDALQRSGLVR